MLPHYLQTPGALSLLSSVPSTPEQLHEQQERRAQRSQPGPGLMYIDRVALMVARRMEREWASHAVADAIIAAVKRGEIRPVGHESLLYVDPPNRPSLDTVVREVDVNLWVERQGHTLLSGSLTDRQRRMAHVAEVARKLYPGKELNLPHGACSRILMTCEQEEPSLFDANGARAPKDRGWSRISGAAWNAARDAKLVRMRSDYSTKAAREKKLSKVTGSRRHTA